MERGKGKGGWEGRREGERKLSAPTLETTFSIEELERGVTVCKVSMGGLATVCVKKRKLCSLNAITHSLTQTHS